MFFFSEGREFGGLVDDANTKQGNCCGAETCGIGSAIRVGRYACFCAWSDQKVVWGKVKVESGTLNEV